MSERIDLKALERKVYLSYHQDGLLDICVGIALILFGILFHPIITEFIPPVAMSGLFCFVFIYYALKRAITIPRVGYVKFLPRRQTRFAELILILVLLTWIPLLLVILLTAGQQISPVIFDFVSAYHLVIIGLFSSGIFALIGLFSEIRRFHGYALTTLSLFMISHFLVLPFALPVIGVGLVITTTGVFQFIWFVRKYPKSTEGDMSIEEGQ